MYLRRHTPSRGLRCWIYCGVQMEATAAAAAAAVIDLSGQLLKAKDQAQQSAWQSQLEQVLQQQKTKLEAFARAQVRVWPHSCQHPFCAARASKIL